MSSNNDIFNDFKKLAESIRKINKDNFDNQKQSLQFYDKTKDIRYLYMVLAHVISEDKYLNDNVLKIEEKTVTIIQHIINLQDRSEQTIKQFLEISKRVKESESLQEELNSAYAKAIEDNRKMKEQMKSIIEELKRKEVERPKSESQNDKEK